MINLIGSVVGLAGMIVGDAILTKWLAAFKFWMEKRADQNIKAKIAYEYNIFNQEMEKAIDKRPKDIPDVPK